MSFPSFFADIPPLRLRDPLADCLGAASDGCIEYRYEDAVRLTGHSCPTVAGAWLMARRALTHLFPGELAERGSLRLELREAREAGTTGVVANVLGLITGAADAGGFKGLNGRFARCGLLHFGVAMEGEVRFTRLDSGAAVAVAYAPGRVAPDPALSPLMQKVVAGLASAAERAEFGRLWQERVRRLLVQHGDDPEVVRILA